MRIGSEVTGALDRVSLRGGQMLIRGWVASRTSRRVRGFRITAGQTRLIPSSWKAGLSHPDARRRVNQPGCGFELRARFKQPVKHPVHDVLISVTPMFRRQKSKQLFAVLKPSFPIPARRDWVLVGSSFLPEGCVALSALVNEAGLGRNESVLDIGCGLGRLAYLLSCYLSPAGRYVGLEPVSRWVRRNRAAVTARFPNFRFREFPVRHPIYNPRGRLDPARARFPYRDERFDLAFATSVFQHNRAAVARNYLSEIARVLRPGGRAVISCFLLDGEPAAYASRKHSLSFLLPLGDCWTATPRLPEAGIAFLERDFRRWSAESGLMVRAQFRGRWRGEGWAKLFQDLLVLRKQGVAKSPLHRTQRVRAR
jgi:SAM-dependent methyltransferase